MAPITALTPEPGTEGQAIAGPKLSVEPATGQKLVSPTAQQTMSNALTMGLPGLGAGFLDTVGQSLGVFDDKTVENHLKYLFPGGGGDYYANNKQAFRAGGEIVGMGIPGIGAYKLLQWGQRAREAGRFGELLKSSTAVDWLLGNSALLTQSEQTISKLATTEKALQGMYSGRTFAIPALDTAKRTYYGARVAETIRQTAAFEGSYRLLYNNSEIFYPSDYTLSDQAKWLAGGTAGAAALDFVVGRYAVRKLIQGAAAKSKSILEGLDQSSEVVFRPGDRGAGITYMASQKSQFNEVIKNSTEATQRTNLQSDITAVDSILSKQLDEMARDPHEVLPRTALDKDQKQLAMTALQKNETTFLYATRLGQVPADGVDKFYTAMNSKLGQLKDEVRYNEVLLQTRPNDKTIKSALADATESYNKWQEAHDEIHYVIENTGDYSIYRNRANNWLDNHSFADIKPSTEREVINPGAKKESRLYTPRTTYTAADGSGTWSMDDRFIVTLGSGAQSIDHSATMAAASKMIQKWKPVENQQNFIVNEKLPWFQLEGIATLAEQNPAARQYIQYDGKISTMDDLKFEILNQKYKEFNKLMGQTERASKSTISLVKRTALDPSEVIQRLNLPVADGLMNHPLMDLFAAGRLQGMKTLDEVLIPTVKSLTGPQNTKMELVQAAMREAGNVADPTMQFATTGKQFLQNDVRPLFVAAKSTPLLSRNEALIHGMIESRRDLALARLAEIDPKDAPIVSSVLQNSLNTGAVSVAKDVQSLYDGVASGKGNVVYQDRINEQFATLKSAALMAQSNEKLINQLVGELSKAKLTPLTNKLLNTKNKALLFDFNRVEQSYRHGWDIADIERHESGMYRFRLNDTEHNDQLMQEYFGKSLKDANAGTANQPLYYMPDMSVTARRSGAMPLQVQADAALTAKAMSDLSRQSGVEVNALRLALGKGRIQIRDFHLPTPELSREGTYFVKNDTGKVIATYSGGTENANKARALDAAQKLSDATGIAHSAQALDDVRRTHNIYDDTFFDVIDYSDQLRKSGARIRGGLVRTEIDTGPETLKAMASTLNEQFLAAGTRAQAALFEPQLNFAENAAQLSLKNSKLGPSIFDRYQAIIYGRGPQIKEQAITNLHSSIETTLDKSLTWLNAKYTEAIASTEAGKAGARSLRQMLRGQTSEKEFQELNRTLPSWSPFQTTQDWLESTYREAPRVSTRNVAARLSLVSSTMSLRFLDVGMAWLNLAGVALTAPSVLAAYRQRPGENWDELIKRTAAYGSRVSSLPVVTPSSMKVAMNTIHAFWNGELSEPLAKAAAQGLFTPEFRSIQRVLTDPKAGGQSKFERFIDGAAWAADKSEELSRALSWGMGYKLGKELHQFDDDRNAFIFANDFMNNMIGNYNPKNKPAMFRGAIGLPLGAFQTFTFNFYRRLFNYTERKDVAALGAQFAAQSAMFGAQSVPGWGLFNATLFNNYDGSDSLATRLDRNLSPGVADLVLHGTLSSIPKVFFGEGLAFYPRGSTDITSMPTNPVFGIPVPVPTLADINRAPPIALLGTIWTGIQRSLDNAFSSGGFSVQQQTEILAHMTTNRLFSGIMEMAAGAKTDQRGNVIDAATFDAVNVTARLLGTVPTHTRVMMDKYNAQQQVEMNQANLRAVLTDKTRALIRGNELSVERLQPIVSDYMRSGGNPAYFGTWLRNTIETAVEPKAVRQVEELSRSGKWLEFMNLLSAMQQSEPESTKPKEPVK